MSFQVANIKCTLVGMNFICIIDLDEHITIINALSALAKQSRRLWRGHMGEDDGDLSMKKTSLQDRLNGDALQGVTVTAAPRWCRADLVLLRDRWPVIDRESDKAKRIGLNCPFIWRARFERYSYLHLGSTRYRKTAHVRKASSEA
jgi:hypothetical protein